MKSHSGLSRPELASTEAPLVSSWERFRTRMGPLALTKGEGEGEGLVEHTFILYDPSPPSSPALRPVATPGKRQAQRSSTLLALLARGFAPVDR
jgi:hypothetical protein